MAKIYAPTEQPKQHGFKNGDSHLIVNAVTRTAKAYNSEGVLLWELPALADGQHANWRVYQGDTPPGLYKIGAIYNDFQNPPDIRTKMSYGWVTFDLVDQEGNEDQNNRSGIAIHGGGSGLGWPAAWAALQQLLPTWGCVRMHNQHLLDKLLPLCNQGTVFVSVYQDDQ